MNAFFALGSAMWKYAGNRRKTVCVYVLLFVLTGILYLFEPYTVGLLLNTIQQNAQEQGAFMKIVFYLGLLVALAIGYWVLHGPARVLERQCAFHIRTAFADHLFSIVVSLPVQWHKNHHSGQTINRMRKATRALFDFSENGYQLIEMLLRPLFSIVVLAFIFPFAAVLAIIVSVAACTLVFFFDRVLLPLYDQVNEKEHFVASALHDYVTNITTVITLRLEHLARSEHLRRLTHYFPIIRREVRINEFKWFLATFIIAVMTSVVLAWYVYVTLHAGLVPLAGTFFMLYDYLQKIGTAFYTFAWKYSTTVQQYADLKSVDGILQAEPAAYGEACCLPDNWQRLEISNLNFVYKDEQQREHHLKDVAITLRRTAKIALVGESGSGKSTLMAVLRGLQVPDSVTLSCDGKPLMHGLKDVASCVTLIPQEPEIFENTIEYNITLDTDQSNEEVMEDVRLAAFDSVLAKLSKGLQTNTAEKGVNLSGGEKQRLALARGFFAAKHGSTTLTTGSDIILLDEPTSSVDSQNEMQIYRNIMEHFADRCILSSIHKLHLLEFFDEVYVLDQGRVIEHGSPETLMKGDGMLANLWRGYTNVGEKI